MYRFAGYNKLWLSSNINRELSNLIIPYHTYGLLLCISVYKSPIVKCVIEEQSGQT